MVIFLRLHWSKENIHLNLLVVQNRKYTTLFCTKNVRKWGQIQRAITASLKCICCGGGVASYLIQFISHTLNYHISYTLKPTFISHTKYKLRVEYRIHFLLFRRSMFISHTSVNFYAKFLQRSIFHANGPKRPIVSRARLLLGSRG